MKKTLSLILACGFITLSVYSQKPAYQLFDKNGKKAKYGKMIKNLKKADFLFIGELHNDPISHWLEFEITKEMFTNSGKQLILGSEIFESDNQLILDEYLAGTISKKKFEAEMRLWPNYKTDYKPLVEFAKDNKLNFIATNTPRRYASIAYKKGYLPLDSLSEEAKKYLCPLPPMFDVELPCYAEMLIMGEEMGHTTDFFPKSQALKDATMAYFIDKNSEAGTLFIHYNGSYHSDNHEGIVWHLSSKKKGAKIITISFVEQDDIKSLSDKNIGKADYIIAVPASMTKTY